MFNLSVGSHVNPRFITDENIRVNEKDEKVSDKVSVSTQDTFSGKVETNSNSLHSRRLKRQSPDSQTKEGSPAKRFGKFETNEKSVDNGSGFNLPHSAASSSQITQNTSFASQCMAEFNRLRAQYSSLFETDFIQPAPSTFLPMPDVGMDKMLVVSRTKFKYLGTSGIVCCHGICGIGKTETGEVFLALAHITLCDPLTILKKMTDKLVKAGCPSADHAFYVFGGALPASEDEDNICLDYQRGFLTLSEKYSIKEVIFNALTYEEQHNVESYDIVFGEEGVYFKKGKLFNPLEGFEIILGLFSILLLC